ncbi:MAG TPA: DUF4177 domain-containing protein [Anaerolineae bacterium]|nr:DUF4177 domain-containing protein [Anaerolineae bacterium]
MYEYKVIPFIGQVKAGDKDGAAKVSVQLEKLINSMAADGWEFYRIDQVQIAVRPGCLAAIFGARESYIQFDQAIFRRQRP